MTILVLGLILFLGVHSVRIVADGWRSRTIARIGAARWKGLYTAVSLIGFVLIVWGFVLARHEAQLLYVPAATWKHMNALFTLVAFVLFAAAKVPGNHFKSVLGHPQAFGVAVWSIGHLLATGMLHDVVLFGSFGVWGAAAFWAGRARDGRAGTTYPSGTWQGDAKALAGGLVIWALFAFWLHGWLIGVQPFG
ncbi:NnrU family protein [Rudaea sp.]|uniref:NnrU family protein n=1 Tax=Rudaea sp. TaxID=2136325 RepID=UPI002ED36D94